MKKLVFFCLAGLFFFSCAGSSVRTNREKIGQAVKNEGEIFLRQGNYTAALIKLLEAQKDIPKDPFLHNSLGLTYMGKNRNDLAVLSFKKALELKGDYMEAVNNLGAAYLRQGKWDRAIETFTGLLDNLLYPTPHFPLSNIGWAHLGKKAYASAEIHFKKALDLFPEFVTASHGLAQVYFQTGRLDRAVTYLLASLERSPKAPILHADLAHAYEVMGHPVKAKQSWQMVKHLAPENSSLMRTAEDKLAEIK